jgi:DNA-binding SARP family transcriptional activator
LISAGQEVQVPMSGQRLLAFLALAHRPVLRPNVAGSLWMDHSEGQAAGCLRSALWRLPQPGGVRLVESGSAHLCLDEHVRVDVRDRARLATCLLDGTGADRVSDAFDPLSFRDDLLPDWYDDWVIIERERFRQLRIHALEECCTQLAAAGRYGSALQAGLAAVAAEPLRESAHRVVIAAHMANGNDAEALRQFRIFRTLLADALGLDPSASMHALMGRLLAREGASRDRPVSSAVHVPAVTAW